MISQEIISYYAELAEASYVRWNEIPSFADIDVESGLKNSALNGNFSTTQAGQFITHWSVVHHVPNAISGFSATLFESKDRPGEVVLALRGTDQVSEDIILSDIGDIVFDGIALDQVVDLYNYWKSLTTQGSYTAAKLVTRDEETLALLDAYLRSSGEGQALEAQYRAQGLIVDSAAGRLPLVRTIEFGASETLLAGTELALGSGAAIGKQLVGVTGHSLGGHLAAAFTRLFPELGVDALAVNGAGFATNSTVDNLFAMLGGGSAFDGERILNVYGSAAPQLVAQDWYLQQQGGHEEIHTESAEYPAVFGHGKEQMTNSLAVYDLFFRMDGALQTTTITEALSILRPIFEASSGNASGTLESLVGRLGRLYGVLTIDPVRDGREALYAGISLIRDRAGLGPNGAGIGTYRIQSLVGKTLNDLALAATNPDPISTSAIAYRYALAELNPFAVIGADYSACACWMNE